MPIRRPSPWSSLVALAFLACGSSPQPLPPQTADAGDAAAGADGATPAPSGAETGVDRGPEPGGLDDSALVGRWMYASGEREFSCLGASESTSLDGTSVEIARGLDAPLVLVTERGCALRLERAGMVGHLRPGQVCPPQMLGGGTATVTYQSGAFSSLGGIASWQAVGSATLAVAGQTTVCSFRESGTLRRIIGGQRFDAGPASGACLLNSDCPTPLLCAGGRCRLACVETRDCPPGRCVNGPQGHFCLPEAESPCMTNSECPSALVCAVDRHCRNECRADIDCSRGQACADQVCAEPSEVNGGHLKASPGDGGSPDASVQWRLSPGARRFRVTAVDVKVDGCKIDPASVQGMTLPVTHDDATATLSIGNPQGSPLMPALGSGQLRANMASLVRDNLDTAGTCSYHRRNLSTVTLFDHDKFTLDATEDQSMFGSTCTPVPAGGTCTTAWRWRMEIAP